MIIITIINQDMVGEGFYSVIIIIINNKKLKPISI